MVRSGRRWLAAGCALAITACGSVAATAEAVPILWYRSGGEPEAGVSRVTVSATDSGDGPFALDLGGPAHAGWREEAWQAATTGMLTAGRDPRGRVIAFEAPDPLSGGTATAGLAAASWAVVTGERISDSTAVVAGVLPNGVLTPVPGLPATLRAAADAGITTVLVATGAGTLPVPGVTVREVTSLTDAIAVLEDGDPPAPAPPPATDPELTELVTIAATQITDQVRATADEAPPSRRRGLLAAADRSAELIAAGDPLRAYAGITLAQQQEAMARAADDVGPRVRREQQRLVRQARTARRGALARIDLAASTPLNRLEQYPALADALTWGTGTLGLLTIAESDLAQARTRTELRSVAADLARVDYRLRTYLPLQVEAVQQIGRLPAPQPRSVLGILSGYADLLADAGGAALVAAPAAADTRRAVAQRDIWRAVNGASGDQEKVLTRLAAALSFYIAGGYLGAADRLEDAAPATALGRRAFALQAERATATNYQLAHDLDAAGFDPSYVVWGDQWGRVWTQPGTDDRTRATGLTYQWYATVQGRMLSALGS